MIIKALVLGTMAHVVSFAGHKVSSKTCCRTKVVDLMDVYSGTFTIEVL